MNTANIRQHRNFLLLAICCLSQACNVPSDAPISSRKGELISIVSEIAPPIIRSCVVRNVGTLTTEEWNRLVKLSANENPMGSQTARVAVEYVSGNCFENDDFDQEIANSRWSSPDAFISAILSGELLQTYSLPLLQSLIDAYNQHQSCIFGAIQGCTRVAGDKSRFAPSQISDNGASFPNWMPEKKGFSRLSVADFGRLFALTAKTTIRSHSWAIDDGVDEYKTTLFRKEKLAMLSKHDALFIAFPGQSLGALVEGAQTACTGTYFGEKIVVLDGEELLQPIRVKLPKGVDSIDPEESSVPNVLHFRVIGEYEHPALDQEACEPSYWARQFEYRYSLDCKTTHRGGCKLTKRLMQESFGCSSNICD